MLDYRENWIRVYVRVSRCQQLRAPHFERVVDVNQIESRNMISQHPQPDGTATSILELRSSNRFELKKLCYTRVVCGVENTARVLPKLI